MTYYGGPFQNGNMNQDKWELMGQILAQTGVAPGKLNQCAVAAGAGMQITVATGQAWVLAYFFQNDTTATFTLAAADPSNPRIDRVVVHFDRSAYSADIRVLTGTPAGSPVEPALTQNATIWEIPLASVAVAAGATSVGTITDERTFLDVYPQTADPTQVASNNGPAGLQKWVSWLTNAIKGIKGTTNWYDGVPASLSALNTNKAAKAGDTFTGQVNFQTTLSGSNKVLQQWQATDGKTYGLILTPAGGVRISNITDNVIIAEFGPTAGAITANSATVWNSANDGSGSGLDADKLDGNDSTAFAVVGTHSAGQVKISYGSGVPAALDANEIYFQLS